MNIPALSESTLRRDIASSGISLDGKIQVHVCRVYNVYVHVHV